jgi:hypothetical protein
MVSFYIQTINEAYTYYKTDHSSSTQYIQSRLESSYSGYYFDVIIMTENETGGSYLYPSGGSSVVCWSGVNVAQRNWAYIINRGSQQNPVVYVKKTYNKEVELMMPNIA